MWAVDSSGEITRAEHSALKLLMLPATVAAAEAEPALAAAGLRRDAILPVTSGGVIAKHAEDLERLAKQARAFAEDAQTEATMRARKADWAHFTAWCRAHNISALPATPETVAAYLADHASALATATLARRISTIVVANRRAGYSLDTRDPALRDTWRGIRRIKGTAQRRAAALTTPLLKQVLATCGDRLIDLRDRALLLIGFAAACRRSELCALDMSDVEVSTEGLTIRIRRSKTDQEGEGAQIAIGRTGTATCPVMAFETWVAAAGITNGRALRSVDRHGLVGYGLSTRAVSQIVQARAEAAGLDARTFSGHSLRAGFATAAAAAAAGIDERLIMRQTRHTSAAMVRRYIRDGERWRRNLAAEVGL